MQNSIWLILISGLLEAERMNKSYGGVEIKSTCENIRLHLLFRRIFVLFGSWTRSKIYLQIFQNIWSLVWVNISFPIELQPVQLPTVFWVLFVRPLAVWKREWRSRERDWFHLIIQTNISTERRPWERDWFHLIIQTNIS